MNRRKRIGILTAGGDSPGLNAAIRAVGKAALGTQGWEVVGFRDGFAGLIEDRWTTLDKGTLAGILTNGGTILNTSRIKPHKVETEDGPRDMRGEIVKTYRRHGLDAGEFGPGARHDSGAGAVLRRHGPPQERARDDDAVVCRYGRDRRAMGADRVLPGVRHERGRRHRLLDVQDDPPAPPLRHGGTERAAPPVEQPVGDSLTLLGAGWPAGPVPTAAAFPLELYWRVEQPLPAKAALHLGLMDGAGEARQAWFNLTLAETFNPAETIWQPGDVIHTRWQLELLPEVVPGEYYFELVSPDDVTITRPFGRLVVSGE